MYRPYDDGLVIASQIMAIVSVFVSWIWWVTFVITIVAMILVQLLWCCRQNVHSIYASSAVAAISSLVSLGLGIYILVEWRHKKSCFPFVIYSYGSLDGDDYYGGGGDYCEEKAWGIIAIVCGALWFGVSVCLFRFAKSGKHAKWENHHSKTSDGGESNNNNNNNNNNPVAVELGVVPEVAAVATTILESDQAAKADIAE